MLKMTGPFLAAEHVWFYFCVNIFLPKINNHIWVRIADPRYYSITHTHLNAHSAGKKFTCLPVYLDDASSDLIVELFGLGCLHHLHFGMEVGLSSSYQTVFSVFTAVITTQTIALELCSLGRWTT